MEPPVITRSHRLSEDTSLSTDKQGTRILARTFFNQLRASGYTPMQIIGIATELLDLVTEDIKGGERCPADSRRPGRSSGRKPERARLATVPGG